MYNGSLMVSQYPFLIHLEIYSLKKFISFSPNISKLSIDSKKSGFSILSTILL